MTVSLPRLRRDTALLEQAGKPTMQFQIWWSQLVGTVEGLAAPFAVRSTDATGDLLATDYLVLADATAGAITLTLPVATDSEGALIVVKKTDVSANAVTVGAADNIDGAATQALAAQYDAITVACDGATWWIV